MATDLPHPRERHSATLVRVAKGPELLAQQLRERILSGEIGAGEMLPPERTLSEQSGLGRSTVRESLRLLEAEGLVGVRTGRNGGALVCSPDKDLISRQLHTFIRGRRLSAETVFDAREVIEVATAGIAARNRTESDLSVMREAMEAMEADDATADAVIQLNIAWHLAVARASGNELLAEFMASLSMPVIDHLREAAAEPLRGREAIGAMCLAHRSIFKAIEGGDADAASRRMARHLRTSRQIEFER